MVQNNKSVRWVLTVVKTGQKYSFGPGNIVIIGRKPLRPTPVQANIERLDIEDSTKSMSKQHLRLVIRENSEASIRDLNSTNGTYIVQNNGELTRLPLNQDFSIDQQPLRLQLGDVGIELEKRAVNPEETVHTISSQDLFTAAHQNTDIEGVDSPSLSVDDVLDLRAGEPTSGFDTESVRRHIANNPISESAQSSFEQLQKDLQERSVQQQRFLEDEESQGSLYPQDSEMSESEKENDSEETQNESDLSQLPHENNHKNTVHDGESSSRGLDDIDGEQQWVESTEASPSEYPDEYISSTPTRNSEKKETDTSPQYDASQSSYTEEYQAAFEPGSVLDRLTKGKLVQEKPAVEIGNLNSDDAQHTKDETKQFEMAKHHELLPFLALNPYLYNDLYAWLEALGQPDIEDALHHNDGYQEYLKKK